MKLNRILLPILIGTGLFVNGSTAEAAEKHEVEVGDTLSEIAEEYGTTLDLIIEANPDIDNPDLIFPNQLIQIEEEEVETVLTEKPKKDVVKPSSKTTKKQQPKEATAIKSKKSTPDASVNADSLDLLARIIEAESKGEPYAGKVAVGEVVLNRVSSGQFPNSIQGVIYQQGQFQPVSNGAINNAATFHSIRAAKEALNNGGNANGALYFYNPKYAGGQSWFETLEYVTSIGNHVFRR